MMANWGEARLFKISAMTNPLYEIDAGIIKKMQECARKNARQKISINYPSTGRALASCCNDSSSAAPAKNGSADAKPNSQPDHKAFDTL